MISEKHHADKVLKMTRVMFVYKAFLRGRTPMDVWRLISDPNNKNYWNVKTAAFYRYYVRPARKMLWKDLRAKTDELRNETYRKYSETYMMAMEKGDYKSAASILKKMAELTGIEASKKIKFEGKFESNVSKENITEIAKAILDGNTTE